MTAIYKEKCLAPSERGQCFSSLPNTNIQAINISCLLACEPNLNMCTKRVFLSLSLQASKLRCSIVLISKMGIPFDIIIYKSREIFIYTRVVRKCTKYMISNKSNLQHVTFGIKIHVVGCFDPLRPSGLS